MSVEIYLMTQGLFFKTKDRKLINIITQEYTFERMEGFGKYLKKAYYPYYKKVLGGILVPRTSLFNPEIKPFIKNIPIINYLKSKDIKIYSKALYSDNQKIVLNYVIDQFNAYLKKDQDPLRTGCIVVMGTGLGKTYLAIGFIASIKKKALYVTYDEKSLLAAHDTLSKFLSCKIGLYYGKKKEDGDVVIAIVNSLLNAPTSFFDSFGTVIYDELPEYITDTRYELFFKCNCFNIGLTATPEKGGLEKIAIDMVGPLIYADQIKGYNIQEVEFNGTVHVINYKNQTVIKREYTDFMQTIKTFLDDKYRMQIILLWMHKLVGKGKSVYIFATLKSILETLYFKCPYKKAFLKGGALQEDYEDARKAQVIFTTYKFGDKALSIAHMDAIIYATPRKENTQSLGRILRRDGDPLSKREIVDIVDSCFYKQYPLRKKVYLDKGYNIIKHKSFISTYKMLFVYWLFQIWELPVYNIIKELFVLYA